MARWLLTSLILCFAPGAWSCGCSLSGTYCSALSTSRIVFVGLVTQGSTRVFGGPPGKMVVEEIFRGQLTAGREVAVDTLAGSSCGFNLTKGERYVIYGYPASDGSGQVWTSSCSFSFAVQGHELRLDALRNADLSGKARITGSVVLISEQQRGLSQVIVTATNGTTKLQTKSNRYGEFEFIDLPQGTYELGVSAPGYLQEQGSGWATGQITAGDTGCSVRTIGLWPNGQIGGMVTDSDGHPVMGAVVRSIGQKSQEAITGWNGTYLLAGLPAGEYRIGIGMGEYRFTGPWPTVYYPSGRQQSDAQPILVGRNERHLGINLKLEPARSGARLLIEVVHEDGTPTRSATVRVIDQDGIERVFLASYQGPRTSDVLEAGVYVGEKYRVQVTDSRLSGGQYKSFEAEAGPITMAGPEMRLRIVLLPKREP